MTKEEKNKFIDILDESIKDNANFLFSINQFPTVATKTINVPKDIPIVSKVIHK